MRSSLFSIALTVLVFAGIPAVAQAQVTASGPAAALVQAARDAGNGQTFAAAVATLVRRVNEQPGTYAGPASDFLTRTIRGGDVLRRAIAVDALKSLPQATRNGFVPVLVELIRGGGDTPETRLFVRGLGEVGPQGVAALRELLDAGSLTGRSANRAGFYTRG
jgi:hypothetical protein